MTGPTPVITIQCDWNEVLKLPRTEAWISYKYLNQNSVHDRIRTSMSDGKIKVDVSEAFQYISNSNLSLVLKHVESGEKIVFVAPTKVHNVHKKAVLSVSSAENALAASSCEGDQLLVWDTRTNEQILDLKGHGGPVYKCRFFPSGIVIISAGADGSCRIWSAESGINPVTLIGHTMSIADVCIVDKGRNVISVSKDGTAKLWDVGESRCLDNIIEGQGAINCCALTRTCDEVVVENDREVGTADKLVVIGCESGAVVCAHVAKREVRFNTQLDSPCNSCVVVDETVIVGCSDGKIIYLNITDGSVIKELHESASPVISMASLSHQMFAVGRQDGTCTVYSSQESFSFVRVQLTGSDCDGIRDIAFNGKWILTGSRDANIRKYDFNQIVVHYK